MSRSDPDPAPGHMLAAARTPAASPKGCVVCGEHKGRVVVRHRRFAVHACPCGGAYLSPPPAPDEVDPTEDRHPASFYALPAAMKVRWLKRHRRDGTLLEVGPGEGFFLAAAKAQGFDVAGIEPHPARASALAARLGVRVECSLIEATSWPERSCDVVYHCDLLSHFPEPRLALAKMKRLLRPGGILFFEVGLVGLDGGIADRWYRWLPEHSFPRHRWLFSREALGRLLRDCGLRIEHLRTFGLAPQVLFYRSAGPLFRAARAVVRACAGRKRTDSDPAPAGVARRERPLEGWLNNALRFGVGGVVPGWGPSTCFVIASAELPRDVDHAGT